MPIPTNIENRFSKIWNSPRVGIFLWICSACFSVKWYFHLPTPGKAIGAIAVVAGIMSVREMKVLAKISWVFLLIFMLITEFRAIDRDHAENEQKQREFFEAQKKWFDAYINLVSPMHRKKYALDADAPR